MTQFPEDEPQSVLKAVTMYKSCLDTNTIEQLGIAPILDVVNDYGGWPMIDSTWTPNNYEIMDVVGRLSHLGVGVFIGSSVSPSFEDSTQNVLTVSNECTETFRSTRTSNDAVCEILRR